MDNKIKDFPLLTSEKIIYLDSASTTQKPQQVLDAVNKAYTEYNANPGRGIYDLAEQATQQYEDARMAVAQFINAQPKEIVFVRGATEGINFIATGWGRYHIKKNDRIVLSELEHHANLLPWQRVAKEVGAELVFISVLKDGMLDMDAAEKLINKKTKLVAVTHASNAIGTPVDIQAITRMAKKVGAKVLIDACQSAPREKLDVKKIGCDFLVFSGHKMLGPTGIGVLYIREDVQEKVQPLCLGGGAVREVSEQGYSLADAPQKFEAGTPSLAQAVGLHAAINYLTEQMPLDKIKKHDAALTSYAIDELQKMPHITLYGPLDQLRKSGHSVTFTVKNMHAHDVAAFLNQKKICVRAGHFCAQPLARKLGYDAAVRASFYCYTRMEDVEKLVDALTELSELS